MIPLETRRSTWMPLEKGHQHTAWKEGEPFFNSDRGRLIHRVRAVDQIEFNSQSYPYGTRYNVLVETWCGSRRLSTDSEGMEREPSGGKLVCERCEQAAIDAGMPSSEELTGRHVHVGRCRVVQTCCQDARLRQ